VAYNGGVDVNSFDKNSYLSLITFRKSGAEVATPVWFAALGDKLYVFSAGEAGKVKRLRNSDRARIAPCDVRGAVHGPTRDTTARLVGDRALIARVERVMSAKYGWQMWIANLGARLTGRVAKRAYIEIDF
jgi:PPOX class probable F420-dependent enzyme